MSEQFDDEPYDNGYLKSGWSMTVGEMRKAIEGVPDETEIVLDQGDCEIQETHIEHRIPGSPMEQCELIVISAGQVISHEYSYHDRLDMWLDFGGESWQSDEKRWKR